MTPELRGQLLDTIRRFVDREVIPVASRYEHADEYPRPLVDRMRELGLFGATIPVEYGGLGLDYSTYAMIVEELCRGWMSLSGVLNTHLMFAFHVGSHGTDAYRILGLIFWIVATLFLARGARIALGYAPETWWTPVSITAAAGLGWMSEGMQRATMWTALWVHLLIILGFLVYLGYSKHLHIATSAINVWLANTRPRGTLAPLKIDLEAAELILGLTGAGRGRG